MDRQQCFIGEIATFEGFGSLIFGTWSLGSSSFGRSSCLEVQDLEP
jgi:hypothetical protein